jgi:hypothetical protein
MTGTSSPLRRAHHFCRDLLHDLNLEVALGQELLQPGVLLLEAAKRLDVGGFELAVSLAPQVQRLLADAVLLRYFRYRRLVGLAEDLDHLVFGESDLRMGSSLCREPSSQDSAGRKSPGRSDPKRNPSEVRRCSIVLLPAPKTNTDSR